MVDSYERFNRFDDSIKDSVEMILDTLKAEQKRPEFSDMLSLHCPGLKTFDWTNYLLCSMYRVDKTMGALDNLFQVTADKKARVKILDFGAWLDNFSLALALDGWASVTACEMWMRYSPALDAFKKLLANYRVDTIDSVMITGRPQGPRYDVVLLMSVIEHIPDTPRGLLQQLYNALMPGGFLILDTPNLAYIANRRKLSRGVSPYVPVQEQWETAPPFEGHVREYTAAELTWMLEKVGFRVESIEGYNYSMYGVQYPHLMNLRSLIPMARDPLKRELLFVVAKKPEFSKYE